MSKKHLLYIIVLLTFTFIFVSCNDNRNYTGWKDTHEIYGDGTYSSFAYSLNNQIAYGLSNNIYHEPMIDQILSEKEVDGKLYVYGNHLSFTAYIIIDLKNGTAIYYPTNNENESLMIFSINRMIADGDLKVLSTYNDFSEQDRAIFQKMLENK